MSPPHNSSNYIICLFLPTRWSMLYWRQPPRGGGRKSIKCSTHQANKRGCCMHRTRWFAQNSIPVSCKQKHIMYHVSSITTQLVVLNKHTMQFRCLLMVGIFCSMQFGWSPLHFAVYYGHLNIVNQLVNVCRLPPEQKTKVRTYRWPRTVGMSSTGCLPCNQCLSPRRTKYNQPFRVLHGQ